MNLGTPLVASSLRLSLLGAAVLLPGGVASAQTELTAAPPPPADAATSAAPTPPADESPNPNQDLPTPGFWEGGGIKIGDLIFHPSFQLQTAYQTNVFYQDSADNPGALAAGVMRIGVSGTLSTLSAGRMELEAPGDRAAQRLAFNGSAQLMWNQFISPVSGVTSQSDLAANLLAGLILNPEGQLSLSLHEGYTRSVLPLQTAALEQARDRNELGARGEYRPGGGALSLYGQYQFALDLFESSVLSFDNRFTHQFSVGGKWQWLPKTQVHLDVNLWLVEPNDQTFKSSSMPLRVVAGVNTLITPLIGLLAQAGYGNAFYSSGPSYSSWLATLEGRYAIGPTIRVAAGYSHDFADALIGNYYADHVFYARYGMQFLERWQLRARAELRLRSYEGIHDTATITYCGDLSCPKTRDDVLTSLSLALEYQINAWLFAGAHYSLQADSTSFFIRSSRGLVDRGSYVWNEIMGEVAARF
jgi:hypothetical protein